MTQWPAKTTVPVSIRGVPIWKRAGRLRNSQLGTPRSKIAFVPSITLYGPGSPLVHGTGDFWVNLPNLPVTVDSFLCRDQNLFFGRKVLWLKRCARNLDECQTPGACMDVITPEKVLQAFTRLLR